MENIMLNRSHHTSGATSQFKFVLLKQITNNFSEDRIIGCGADGVVYKGVLDSGEEIAVKKLIYEPPDHDSEQQFHNGCTNLMRVQHQNIVRLVGYCCETSLQCVERGGLHDFADENERALCFEYLQGGSLDKHVSDEPCRLDWDTCYKIIKGICEGLNHLHNGYKDSIFHLDLKPANILLDNNMIPKIGGFGLSRLFRTTETCTTKTPLKTLVYTPPEFVDKQEISPKYDVFSLGVVIIHIMAGRKHYYDHADTPSKIIELVCENWGKRLHATMWSHASQEIKTCIEIALSCVRSDQQKRPTIRKIVDDLNRIDIAKFLPTYERVLMEVSICALVDAMFRLPRKLNALLVRHGHMLPRGVADEISLIKQDLEKMVAILQEQDKSGVQDHAMMVKCLTKEVRELSYDMEDSVDQYEHAVGTRRWTLSPRRRKYKITRHRGKTAWWLPEKFKWRLWIANKIREFSVRSQEVLQRYSLFNHVGGNGISSSTTSTSTRCAPLFGSWHPTPYGEPVGINAPLKKLEAWLDKDGEQKLKVVSVVGPGGVGKTTLANELYRRLGGQSECRAFVRTSRKPDVRRLLNSMLSQVRPHQTPHSWKVHSLIADIRTHLQDKRYLVVIDGIWDTQTWDIINRALPDGNLCSGILITTEVEDVALKCCGYGSKYVFTMKPLGHDESSKLFLNTAFDPKYGCPSELSEVANNIIRKCAGFPLATVIIANTLVGQMSQPEQWDYVNKSLGYGLRTNLNSEGMKQVLNLSYNSLPEHLKACVMYLSIYEEDYIIQKDDIVNQWIAEGFIRATEEKDKEEVSRSYFDELISRRMIQPVHVNDNDDVLSCSVHYMVLDFVTHKSMEENYVTTINHCQTTARLADKVRRLSLHFGNTEATSPTNMGLSQVRTLAFFGLFKCLPSIMDFGLLQILILHLWADDEIINFDLTRISELFRLRYLHVTCDATLEVPQTQMRGLEYLETLKIDARVSAVPSDIVHLPGLLHLSLPVETNFPNGIARMTSLCTLEYFDLSVNSIENVQSLGELTNLQDLRLTCSTVPSSCLKNKMDCMGSILAKLSNLKSLTLESSSILDSGLSSISISCDGLSSESSPLALLQRFEWLPHICTFSSIPKWIGHLGKICILKIGVKELVSNDVDVLGGLPALTVLSLYVRTKPAKRIVFNKTGFSVLKYFKFRCRVPWLEFEVDAMPNLRKLKLGFDAHGADQHGTIPVGIMHLSGLKEISAKIGGAGADDPDRRAAESALVYTIKMHPARPTFNIQCLDGMFSGQDDNNSRVQEEEHMTLTKQYKVMEEDSIEQHQVLQKDSRKHAHSWFSALSELNTGAEKQAVHRFSAFSEWKIGANKQADSRTRPQCRIDDMTGLSSSRRWRALLKKVSLKEESGNLRRQYNTMEEDSNEEHGVLQKDYRGDASKNVHGREMLPKWTTQVRLSSLQDIEEHDDGFSWMKYGQKYILGSKYTRGYYRCKHHTQGCQAKKHLQRTDGDPLLLDAMYVGNHTCTLGTNSPSRLGHEQSSVSAGVNAEGSDQGLEHMPPQMPKLSTQMRRRMQVRLGSMEDIEPLDDGYIWRKYGQKDILGFRFPRAYFKCARRGCPARKHVQRMNIDPLLFDVVYDGEHTCAQSAHSLLHWGQVGGSISIGFKEPPATSESQITYSEISGSTAGVRFMSPAMSNSQGNFEMSHQQALAQGTAQAVHSQYIMDSQVDYSLPFSSTMTSALASEHGNSSANVTSASETADQPSHTGNDNLKSNEVSQGFQTSALAVEKPADDGYYWRKYGQKVFFKGSEYRRSYYKCTHANCLVKKKVERTACGQITQIVYKHQHNHQRTSKRRFKDGGNLQNEDDFDENRSTLTGSDDSKRGDRRSIILLKSDSEEINDEAGADRVPVM